MRALRKQMGRGGPPAEKLTIEQPDDAAWINRRNRNAKSIVVKKGRSSLRRTLPLRSLKSTRFNFSDAQTSEHKLFGAQGRSRADFLPRALGATHTRHRCCRAEQGRRQACGDRGLMWPSSILRKHCLQRSWRTVHSSCLAGGMVDLYRWLQSMLVNSSP